MRRGLVWMAMPLVFLQGCLSLGNYASPSLVGEGAWEMGAGTPVLSAMVDTGGVDVGASVYPEMFARYGVTADLELEGRAVVLPPLGGAVGGGFRWALVDSGFRVTAGLSATYYSLMENLTSSSTRWSTVVLYPGVWLGTDRLYGAIRGLWVLMGATSSEGSHWVSGSPGVLFTVGQRLQGQVFDVFPEITLWLPPPGEFPLLWILLGFGIAIHPERKGGG